MANTEGTIADLIQDMLDDLTRAERQLALSVLEDYPASGLGPLSALAKDGPEAWLQRLPGVPVGVARRGEGDRENPDCQA